MNVFARLALTGGAAAAVAALLAAPAGAATPSHHHRHHHHHHAAASPVFVQNDNTSGNTVFVYDRRADGTLARVDHASTGGLGGQEPDSVVDHLAGQGSLTYDRASSSLYAVNAGSNTVTRFAVHGNHVQREQVIRSGGSFPVSVSVHGDLVFVLNADKGGAIQGYLKLRGELVPVSNRQLNLSTTVPAGTPAFLERPGQITFSPDGRDLIVTTKANGSTIEVFPVGSLGKIGESVSTTDATGGDPNVPFAAAFDKAGKLVVAEAGKNTVARFALNPDRSLTLLSRVATGGAATCWIVPNKQGNGFYVDNAGSATISTISARAGKPVSLSATTATAAGVVDATVTSDGRDLYVQGGANGVVDEFRIGSGGKLRNIGTLTVPGAVGGEGIASA